MARRGQTAVAVQRLGLVTKPAAPHRLRVGPRITLGITFGITIGARANRVIGAEGNKVYHWIETHGRGANPSFKLTFVGVIFFPARTGADVYLSPY